MARPAIGSPAASPGFDDGRRPCVSDSRRNGRSPVPISCVDERRRGMGEDLGRRGRTAAACPLSMTAIRVAETDRLVHVVGHEHDRGAEAALDGEQVVLRLGADHRVERAEGFVHQQDVRARRPARGPRRRAAAGRPTVRAEAGRGRRPGRAGTGSAVRRRARSIAALSQPSSSRHGGDVLATRAVRETGRGPGWRSRCGDAVKVRGMSAVVAGRRCSTRPEVGSTSRLIIRSSVVLPEPDVPTIAAIVRGSTVRLTSSTTVVP